MFARFENSVRAYHAHFAATLLATVLLSSVPACTDNGNGPAPTGCAFPIDWTQTDISTDTTIPVGCYLVDDSLTVHNGATLTLSPGVVLRFGPSARLNVAEDGALTAAGTSLAPILLTGQESVPGFWNGVALDYSNSLKNVLDYVTIEYGGGGGAYYSANLTIWDSTRISISHTTLRESAAVGFWFHDASNVVTFDANTVTGNAQGAGSVSPGVVEVLGTNSNFSGNPVDRIWIRGGSTSADQNWPALNAPYGVEDNLTFDHHITLAAGARLVFEVDTGVTVADTGALTAQGTAQTPIVLTGAEPTRGYWRGVEFDYSNSANNVLDYVTIEYGGGGGAYYSANLTIWDETRIAISHTTLRESDACGFWLHDNANVQTFTANTVTANTLGAGSVSTEGIGVLDDVTDYAGNDEDFVLVRGGATRSDQAWSALNVPYLFEESATIDHHTTIAPGVRLVFASDVLLTVGDTGALTAVGTAFNPILLNGVEGTPGYWRGVEFDYSNSVNNDLQFVTIAHGGGGGAYYSANLTLWDATRINVVNCTFEDSANWGIWIHSGATPNEDIATVNSFSGNAAGDVQLEP